MLAAARVNLEETHRQEEKLLAAPYTERNTLPNSNQVLIAITEDPSENYVLPGKGII